MKKITIAAFLFFSIIFKTYAQIPNGDFETWENYPDDGVGCTPPYNVYQKPDKWVGSLPTSCSTNSFSLQKNNESYPAGTGLYSLKIQADLTNGVQGVAISNDSSKGAMNGWIPRPAFPMSTRPTSLFLYYKALPFGGDTIIGLVYFYKNGVVIGNPTFGTNQTISTWTALEVPMTFTTSDVPDSAAIIFTTGAYVRHSESIMYVDNVSFNGFVTSISEANSYKSLFNLYPNPATDLFTLNIQNMDKTNAFVNVYDVVGHLVSSEKISQEQQQINVENLSAGIYMVEVKLNEYSEKQKLIIQK